MRRLVGVLLMAIVTVAAFGGLSGDVMAANSFDQKACNEITDAAQKAALGCSESRQATSVVNNLFNVVISVTGIVAVLVIVFGGQRYIVSRGDPGKIAMAKNMIIYGVIGMIVAALAYAIVNFVLKGVFS